jgi:hypothetical protein
MNSRSLGLLGLACGLLLWAAPAAASHFVFDCPDNRYVSKPLGQMWQFQSPIQAVAPGNDPVAVTFTPHLPQGWAAQWTLQSTGDSYLTDDVITLVAGIQDRLNVQIYPDATSPRYGWVDITIRSLDDPSEYTQCTYTLYSGMPVLETDWTIDCTENIIYQDAPVYFELHNPVFNNLTVPDTLLVHMVNSMPWGWDTHFHWDGVCYYPEAQLRMHPMGVRDSLVIMGFPGETAGVGLSDVTLQSKRNPSITRYCHYRIILHTPGAASTVAADRPGVRVEPNPSSAETAFQLRHPGETSANLSIFGADGRLVRSFTGIGLTAGIGAARWDGRDRQGVTVAPGIYYYRLTAGDAVHRGTLVRTR